jgi:hypothetical protein
MPTFRNGLNTLSELKLRAHKALVNTPLGIDKLFPMISRLTPMPFM